MTTILAMPTQAQHNLWSVDEESIEVGLEVMEWHMLGDIVLYEDDLKETQLLQIWKRAQEMRHV